MTKENYFFKIMNVLGDAEGELSYGDYLDLIDALETEIETRQQEQRWTSGSMGLVNTMLGRN